MGQISGPAGNVVGTRYPGSVDIQANLYSCADFLGVRIVTAPGLPVPAVYSHKTRLILVTPGLTTARERDAVAHEIGHAWYSDTTRGVPAIEARADLHAARLLIPHTEIYRQAEVVCGPHVGAIAEYLGLTSRIVTIYRERVLPTKSQGVRPSKSRQGPFF